MRSGVLSSKRLVLADFVAEVRARRKLRRVNILIRVQEPIQEDIMRFLERIKTSILRRPATRSIRRSFSCRVRLRISEIIFVIVTVFVWQWIRSIENISHVAWRKSVFPIRRLISTMSGALINGR